MKSSLIPNQQYHSIFDIDFAALGERKYLIIDVDNTLLQLHEVTLEKRLVEFFENLKTKGVIKDICLVSNIGIPNSHRKTRLRHVAKQLRAHYIYAYGWFTKPHHRPFVRAMKLMHSTPETSVVIGDQIFTDIRGGNRLGIYTILLKPLGKDGWLTRYRRWQERRL